MLRYVALALLAVSEGCAAKVRMEQASEGYPAFTEKYYSQMLDHFRFGGRSNEPNPRWQQRYLINDEQWTGKGQLKNGCKGPILFYSGNEGPIEAFWNSAGMVVNDLPKKWGALVVFGEHRYYGKSQPFGSASMDKDNVMYLTTEQALADYAELITSLKKELNAENCPVISFGGSYGATLTTFFRVKYPHIIAGGLAASTPLGYYDPEAWPSQGVTPYTWIDIVNKDYQEAGCLTDVISARKAIAALAATSEGRNQLKTQWGLCKPPTSKDEAVFLFTDMIETFPQMDYPYQIGPTPAWPVNATCSALKAGGGSDAQLIATVGKLLLWYYAPSSGCIADIGQGGVPGGGPPTLGGAAADAWSYESCTETLHEFSGRGVRDFQFNMTQVNDLCRQYYGVEPRPNWFPVQFGGYQINTNVSEVTNVIFSNGLRDPWHGGGFLKQVRPSCPVFLMPNGAHHVDLRAANPADTPDITSVRNQEEAIIKKWIDDASS
eukprot:TRINITY_DN6744_c0_g1_i1.p1 TRINITY_DN6744_c0_g1~~TRINITY_DN6744_c0_g1_i1.p1  ORF type:complete len:492 (+),score=144.60 TRINITY_DN6744_c0_g1_i1:782-2257(+)